MGAERETLIRAEGLCHEYGRGALQRRVLDQVDAEVGRGEIVILTGPSGSGKTTLLTLMGALRSGQEGRLEVLGESLIGASRRRQTRVRRRIGYIFQQHNLLDSLDARQNVMMSLALQGHGARRELARRADEILDEVGLAEFRRCRPQQLSGGQRQRVGIARALAHRPELILADEPTASLDRQSGREVVTLMRRLAREQGVTVVLVTHDPRILDVADRILHLEDGRMKPFSHAVSEQTRHMMRLLADQTRRGELHERVAHMPESEFTDTLAEATREAESFLDVSELAQDEAFSALLEQMLWCFTTKVGDLLGAERASLFLRDEDRGELWSLVARDGRGRPVEIRLPDDQGIAGDVVCRGLPANVPDAARDPRFLKDPDRRTGFETRSVLAVPLVDRSGRVFGVSQALNRSDGRPFDARDEARFTELVGSISVLLESWDGMRRGVRREPPPALEEAPSRRSA